MTDQSAPAANPEQLELELREAMEAFVNRTGDFVSDLIAKMRPEMRAGLADGLRARTVRLEIHYEAMPVKVTLTLCEVASGKRQQLAAATFKDARLH